MLRSFLLSALLVVSSARAAGAPVVAVMPLQANGVTSGDAQLVADAVGSHLQENGAFRVMERSQMEKILAEQGFQQSGACDGTECAVQAGQILGIDRMVVGSVGHLGSAWVLNLRMVSVGTGEVLASTSRSQKGEVADLITALAPVAVADLVSRAGKPAPAPAPTPTESVQTGGSSAWLWWTLGGVAVAGGAAAAVVLLSGDGGGSGSNAGAPDDGVSGSGASGTFEVKWKK